MGRFIKKVKAAIDNAEGKVADKLFAGTEPGEDIGDEASEFLRGDKNPKPPKGDR